MCLVERGELAGDIDLSATGAGAARTGAGLLGEGVGALTTGADLARKGISLGEEAEGILNRIGGDRRQRAQDVINEDIKRFNYAQLTPQQQQDRILLLLTGLEGIKQGKFQAPQGDRSSDIFGNLARDFVRDAGGGILDSIFENQGGPVYRQGGGTIQSSAQQVAQLANQAAQAAGQAVGAVQQVADLTGSGGGFGGSVTPPQISPLFGGGFNAEPTGSPGLSGGILSGAQLEGSTPTNQIGSWDSRTDGDFTANVTSPTSQGDLFQRIGDLSSNSDLFSGSFNAGGPVYRQAGGMMGDPMMDQGMPQDPMMAGGAPMPPGGGIMSGPAPIEPSDPMMGPSGGIIGGDMGFEMEPMSEIDKLEDAVEMLVSTTGAPLKVTRKTVKAKSKKGG